MELEPQILTNNDINVFSKAMYYDILSPNSYSLNNYHKATDDSLEFIDSKKINVSNQSLSLVNIARSVMPPPPPHKIVNYNNNNVMKRYQPRNSPQGREIYRPISPKEYDSDESYTSRSSRETPQNNRMTYTNSRSGPNRLDEQTLNMNKNKCNNFHGNKQYQSNVQQCNSNGNFNKNRHYYNSKSNSTKSSQRRSVQQKNNEGFWVKRAHGLVKRFISRAEVMKINPDSANLISGGPWDQLNKDIWNIYSSKAQKETTYQNKINSWKNIFLSIRECLNNYGLFMVGSTMSGFGLESSDIDMCLLTKPCSNDLRLDSLNHLNTVKHLLLKNELIEDPELILAKVPILKFKEKQSGFEVDLNCNNSVGIRNTHLLYCYARLDWRVRPLVIIVKIWAQANNINDAKNMTVSSYSWALMVLHYLQCGVVPPVLPCLHGLLPDKFNPYNEKYSMDVQEELSSIKDFNSDNPLTLAELLIGFFHYYASYDFSHYAISVRAGCSLLIDECRFTKAPKNDPNQWKYLCIEEPFDYTNTARSVFDLESFRHIKNIITASYEQLSCTNELSSILPLNVKQEIR